MAQCGTPERGMGIALLLIFKVKAIFFVMEGNTNNLSLGPVHHTSNALLMRSPFPFRFYGFYGFIYRQQISMSLFPSTHNHTKLNKVRVVDVFCVGGFVECLCITRYKYDAELSF